MRFNIDISENDLRNQSEELLAELLRDHTTGENIFWATDNYEALGVEYGYYAPILSLVLRGSEAQLYSHGSSNLVQSK